MPRFYFHVCDETGFVEDDEGKDYPDLGAARDAATEGLRDILAAELRKGGLNTASFIEIEDEHHELVATINFEDVVQIFREGPTRPSR